MKNKNQGRESGQEKNKKQIEPIVWQAPEFEYVFKDVSWYWISLIVAAILLILALWQKNFLFAVFVVIAEAVVFSFANRFPAIWKFKIDGNGVSINFPDDEIGEKNGEKFYSFNEINGFDIHPVDKEYKELVFKFESKFSSYLKINIFADDEPKISELLLKFLPREEIKISMSDILLKLIKF